MSSATTLPSLRTVIRPQRRSASARSCVVRTIVASCGRVDLLDEGLDVELRARVQAGGRFVQEQQRRARQQGSRDGDLLLHPPAHLLDGAVDAFLADAQPGQDRDRIALGGRAVEAVEPRREDQVLHRAELLEEGGVDADPVDQALDRHLLAFDVVAEDLDPALVEGQQARDEADERRLPRAVGAEDPVDVAALEAQRHVGDGVDRLLVPADHEALADAVDEQGRDAGGHRPDGRPQRRGVDLRVVRSVVAVTVDSRLDGGRAGHANEPRARLRRWSGWASRLVVSSWSAWRAGKGIKKAGGPIWPTARGLSGRRSCRLRLARDGHRSPARGDADRRRRVPEDAVHRHSEGPS